MKPTERKEHGCPQVALRTEMVSPSLCGVCREGISHGSSWLKREPHFLESLSEQRSIPLLPRPRQPPVFLSSTTRITPDTSVSVTMRCLSSCLLIGLQVHPCYSVGCSAAFPPQCRRTHVLPSVHTPVSQRTLGCFQLRQPPQTGWVFEPTRPPAQQAAPA